MGRQIGISVVSHSQGGLVKCLLDDLQLYCHELINVVLIVNIKENLPFLPEEYKFPIQIVQNKIPKGFGANHNFAFNQLDNDYFCIVNPDIRLQADPFQPLIQCCTELASGLVAPLVVDASGRFEDSARNFPSPVSLFKKMFRHEAKIEYAIDSRPISPDWVAGMFMMFPRHVFRDAGGFDERFFLYYEDVELCARLRLNGFRIHLCPGAAVTHHARRKSHRNVQYMKWHLKSILKFFFSSTYLKLLFRSSVGKR